MSLSSVTALTQPSDSTVWFLLTYSQYTQTTTETTHQCYILLGGKVLGEYGIYHHMHTVIFYRCSASVFLHMMRSVGVQWTFCVRVSHSTEVVRCVANLVFLVDGVTLLLVGMHCIVWIAIMLHVWCFISEVCEPCLGACHKRHFCWTGTAGGFVARMHYY